MFRVVGCQMLSRDLETHLGLVNFKPFSKVVQYNLIEVGALSFCCKDNNNNKQTSYQACPLQ